MDGTTSAQQNEVETSQVEANSMEAIEAAEDETTLDNIFKSMSEPANQNKSVEGQQVEETSEENAEESEQNQEEDNSETKPNSLVFGKYSNIEDAEKAFKLMQAENTKVVQRLKELEKQASSKTLEQLKDMDYDDQMKVLLQRVQEFEEFKAVLSEAIETQKIEEVKAQDLQQITTFAQKNPVLSLSPALQTIWRLVATHPEMENKVLHGDGGIYDVLFKPALDKIMGSKLIPKKKPIPGNPGTPDISEIKNLNDMPLEFFADDNNVKKLLGAK